MGQTSSVDPLSSFRPGLETIIPVALTPALVMSDPTAAGLDPAVAMAGGACLTSLNPALMRSDPAAAGLDPEIAVATWRLPPGPRSKAGEGRSGGSSGRYAPMESGGAAVSAVEV